MKGFLKDIVCNSSRKWKTKSRQQTDNHPLMMGEKYPRIVYKDQ